MGVLEEFEARPLTSPARSPYLLPAGRPSRRSSWPSPLSPLRPVVRAVCRWPWLLTALLCVVSLAFGLTGPDTPAAEYRAWLFRHAGPVLWDDQWYAGHTVPGYSVLFPPLGALLGVAVVGTAACVASTVIMTRLVRGRAGAGHDLGLVWFAVATVANLVVGRLPFALGMTFGVLALLGAKEGRPWVAGVGAVLCSLGSPLAGGFLVLAAMALYGSWPRRQVLPLAGAFAGLLVAAAFPERGTFPFPAGTLAGVLLVCGVGLLVVPREAVVFRRGLLLYAAASLVFFFVPTPIGGNMARPASLLAGPVAAIVLRRRPRALLLVAAPLVVWQIAPVQGALATYRDPSGSAAYYQGLLNFLDHGPVPIGRVEIPMTRAHWEASFVAPHVPLARGWYRQLDTQYGGILYSDRLSAKTYHTWLSDNGVRYVALPDVELDPSAETEAKLLRSGLPYLHEVWRDAHWRVWLVTTATGLIKGRAQLTALDINTLTLDIPEPGVNIVLVHYTPYWQLDEGQACVFETADGWTGVLTEVPGEVTLTARLSVNGLLTRPRGLDCPADDRPH